MAGANQDAALIQGPPIRDIVTPFDTALSCLKGKISNKLVFSVGAIEDRTGKESFTDGGTGKFVTQGAGDIVQSALFKAGATVVNRRDPRITTTEIGWKIKSPKHLIPTNFYITGSINSLDFIPGSGAEVQVAGVGPRYRQNRILVGLDLALTQASTSRVVADVPLQKQIFQDEAGIGFGRFLGDTLVAGDIGGREREATNLALRQMLNFATFDLLTQVMKAKAFEACRPKIDTAFGSIRHTGTKERLDKLQAMENGPGGHLKEKIAAMKAEPAEADETKAEGEKVIRKATQHGDGSQTGHATSTRDRARAQALFGQ
ncbi:HfaB protein [Pararhizobium mangrovi]|uniref:HfaB protein n=1 Tax=Pararhizobium mangrovi TaxID=2590452 RepID=A0A506TVQ4_9HYPH|nr:HfaB protein [Pararhizobium mangrovi]